MSSIATIHGDLLLRVAEQLARTPTTTDHLMLTKWRVLSMCQYLLGDCVSELEIACRTALETFADHGAGIVCDKALETAGAVVKQTEGQRHNSGTMLPSISPAKRAAVAEALNALASPGLATIAQAKGVLAAVRERIHQMTQAALPGIRHRFDAVASLLVDETRSPDDRIRAAAAVLYVNEINDVIPDTLGAIGLIDDDHALRIALEDCDIGHAKHLHWSEKISSLWDDLPFLQGVNLQRGDSPISVSWLDRVNSYISYSHVLGARESTLVLLQPSVACSPLHAIVSLVGLLMLDAVTNSATKSHALRKGTTYELDGHFVRFEGTAGPPTPGWLRLRLRDGITYRPPGLADRMVPVEACRLSSLREFSARPRSTTSDPIQCFFDWDTAIGPASVTSRLAIVSSRQRALDLLEGVGSNGVCLLEHGLVRFVGAIPEALDTHGTLVLVLPSLSTARLLLDRGTRLQAILVDGYERLHRGRHELPFLVNRPEAPPIINWSATGYYPSAPPTWLPPHRRLAVTSGDLIDLLALDDASSGSAQRFLWEAATGNSVQTFPAALSSHEIAVVKSIEAYLEAVRASESLPEYWRYHLITMARTLQILVTATPAEWSALREFVVDWSSSLEAKWGTLRASAMAALANIRAAEKSVGDLVAGVEAAINTRAEHLAQFMKSSSSGAGSWYFVCDRPEQAKIASSAIRTMGLSRLEPVLLRDLAVCNSCVVTGWIGSSFARRLWAHTPKTLVAVADELAQRRWKGAAETLSLPAGESVLDAVDAGRPISRIPAIPVECTKRASDDDAAAAGEIGRMWDEEERVPCVFLWVTGEAQAKVLDPCGQVVVEEGDVVHERSAARLRPDDRVILGVGTSRWSPADEFTGAVIDAVHKSHPELVTAAREWRRALKCAADEQDLSLSQLRDRLGALGVAREAQTLEGWLDLGRGSPIAPRGAKSEIAALWPMVERFTSLPLDEICDACSQLRSLRTASGRALLQLWKGKTVDLNVDGGLLDQLVAQLRQEVHVYEVEAVSLGEVPTSMLGWWVAPTVANDFESSGMPAQGKQYMPSEDARQGE